jgi:hypothetical protein
MLDTSAFVETSADKRFSMLVARFLLSFPRNLS